MVDYKIKIEIIKILEEGQCPGKHKVGQVFNYPEDTSKICLSALHSIYPTISVMASGGSFPWFETPNSNSNCCPDYKHPVVFKISREKLKK